MDVNGLEPHQLHITGRAVALHCCKTHANINRKMGNSTPCKIVTSKNFNLKLCIRDYVVRPPTKKVLVLIDTVGASHIGEMLPLCDFFWLSCPSFFFSGTRPGRTEPIFTLYGFISYKRCLLGVRTMGNVIWGKYAPKPSKTGCE